jgi:hypothetical protein
MKKCGSLQSWLLLDFSLYFCCVFVYVAFAVEEGDEVSFQFLPGFLNHVHCYEELCKHYSSQQHKVRCEERCVLITAFTLFVLGKDLGYLVPDNIELHPSTGMRPYSSYEETLSNGGSKTHREEK